MSININKIDAMKLTWAVEAYGTAKRELAIYQDAVPSLVVFAAWQVIKFGSELLERMEAYDCYPYLEKHVREDIAKAEALIAQLEQESIAA